MNTRSIPALDRSTRRRTAGWRDASCNRWRGDEETVSIQFSRYCSVYFTQKATPELLTRGLTCSLFEQHLYRHWIVEGRRRTYMKSVEEYPSPSAAQDRQSYYWDSNKGSIPQETTQLRIKQQRGYQKIIAAARHIVTTRAARWGGLHSRTGDRGVFEPSRRRART